MKRKCDKCGLIFKAPGDMCPQCGNNIAEQEAEKQRLKELNAEKLQSKKLAVALVILLVVLGAAFLISNPEFFAQFA